MYTLQDVRQRNRYLSHLPLTCEFSICELALQPPLVSKETLEIFSGENALLCFPFLVEFRDSYD